MGKRSGQLRDGSTRESKGSGRHFSTGVRAAGYGKGKIVAWAPLEDSDFVDSAGAAAPLWKLVYDEVRV